MTSELYTTKIRINFITRYVYTYTRKLFLWQEANAVQQNDNDEKKTDNKKN